MKVVIEKEDCISCGTCMSLCGEVLEFGEERGLLVVPFIPF